MCVNKLEPDGKARHRHDIEEGELVGVVVHVGRGELLGRRAGIGFIIVFSIVGEVVRDERGTDA